MTSAPDEGSQDPKPRPPKKGEPWPKRFTFTPDGAMSFVKHDARPQRRPGPGRRPPDRGPGGPQSAERDFRGPPRRPGEGRGPGRGDFRQDRPGGPRRPAGGFERDRERPPERRGPNAGPARGPGGWSSAASRRTFQGPGRPQFQASFRRPPGPAGPPREDGRGGPPRRPLQDGPRPADRPRGGSRPRPERGGPVPQRVTARFGPRDRSAGDFPARRPLPRPQAGLAGPADLSAGPQEDTPASRELLAARILERATASIPADLLLRQTLARRRQLSRADGAWISRAVFSVFRWQGWLDPQASVADRIEQALALADDFAISPAGVSDEALVARAVPPWTAEAAPATAAWLRSLQREPALWLRARPGMRDTVLAQLGPGEAAPWASLPDALRYDGQEDLYRHPLFQSGAFEIQDIASQAVGHLCAPQPGETWWDACAGEGGKTLHLSALMGGKGLVWSSDRAAWRLARLKQRAARAGCFNYRGVEWNGGKRPPTRTRFDGILVDAPCSGLGTWGRNPHARWSTTPEDVRELAVVQRDLLEHAAPSLHPGGRLVYAVCTLTAAETTGVAESFGAAHPDFEPLPLRNPLDPEAAPRSAWTLWPQDTQGNGMFVAAWRRRPEPEPNPA